MRRQSGKKSLRARAESGPQPQSNKAGTTFRAVPKIQLLLWLIMPHKLATGWQRSVAACFRTFSMLYPTLQGRTKRTKGILKLKFGLRIFQFNLNEI